NYKGGFISAITDQDAKKYIGLIITLKPGLVAINRDTCMHPYFKISVQNSNDFFYANDRIDKSILKINRDSINAVEIGCKDHPKYSSENSPNFLYNLIVINNNLMIINIKGIYFYLKRVLK
ncbi:MAG: hypothetical protein KGM98_01785, partial [Bacteroidota bacterium]|nr:hypothetical protein [Bacteroidota bacterium]